MKTSRKAEVLYLCVLAPLREILFSDQSIAQPGWAVNVRMPARAQLHLFLSCFILVVEVGGRSKSCPKEVCYEMSELWYR
jgi:hypothetical protein